MSNVADSGEEHSIIWGMFMAVTMNAATFMGKNFLDNQKRLKMWTKFFGKNNLWKQLSLLGDETVIQSSTRKSLRLLRFCVVSW